jgi:hypothetical protein
MAARFSHMIVSLQDALEEVDINPVRLTATDCIGLDALVVPTGSAGESTTE